MTDAPAMMTVDQAARYVCARSVHQFRREVRAGVWPRPIVYTSRPQRWSKAQLDAAMSPAANDQDKTDPALAAALEALGLD